MRDLGFGSRELDEAPAFDDVLGEFGMAALIRLDRRRELGLQDSLVIYPSMRKVGLMGTKNKPGYVPRFDRKQGETAQTGVLEAVWGQFTDKDRRHEPGAQGKWLMAVLLDGRTGAGRQPAEQFGDHGSVGILYQGMKAEEQRRMLRTDQADNDFGDHLAIRSGTLAQIIIRNAQLRLTGQSLLDREQSFTRLVHYPDQPFRQRGHTPCVGSDERGKLFLGASEANEMALKGGIREALQPVPPPAPAGKR